MDDLRIEPTKSTPQVLFSSQEGLLRLKGQSYPENAFAFYQPLLTWAKTWFASKPEKVRVEIHLNYLNTSSSKCLMDLIDLLEQVSEEGIHVRIVWFCEVGNERAYELAEEFMEGLDLTYEIVGVAD